MGERALSLAVIADAAADGRFPRSVPPRSNTLAKRDAITIVAIVALSILAQVLAALYFEATGSLLALGGSAVVLLLWVFVRFRPVG